MIRLISYLFAVFHFVFIALFLYEAIKDWKRENLAWFAFNVVLIFHSMICSTYYMVIFLIG